MKIIQRIAYFIAKSATVMINQGGVLRELVKIDKRGIKKLGELMALEPSYLPRLYKKEKLTESVIQKACAVFNVDPSVFLGEKVPFDQMGNLNKKKSVIDYEERITELEESIKSLAAELEREKAMTDTMRKALDKYFDSPDT